jgi:hypothetical protein
MYDKYKQLCDYVSLLPVSQETYDNSLPSIQWNLISVLETLLKQLEVNSKPKGETKPERKAALKEGELVLPYSETALKKGYARDFNIQNLPSEWMIDIKNSIQNEFMRREKEVSFKPERLGLELIVSQKAQMSLFDPRTTVKNSKLYNQ